MCRNRPLGTSTKNVPFTELHAFHDNLDHGYGFYRVCVEPLPEATVLLSPKSRQRRVAGLLRRSPTSAQFYHHFFMSRTRADDAFVLIDRSGQVPSTAIKTCLPSSHPSLQQASIFSSARHSAPTPMCLCAACTHCQRTSQRCSCTYPYTFAECTRKTNSAVHIFTVTSQNSLQPATPPSPSDRATPWSLSLSLGRLIVRYLGHRPNFSISFHFSASSPCNPPPPRAVLRRRPPPRLRVRGSKQPLCTPRHPN